MRWGSRSALRADRSSKPIQMNFDPQAAGVASAIYPDRAGRPRTTDHHPRRHQGRGQGGQDDGVRGWPAHPHRLEPGQRGGRQRYGRHLSASNRIGRPEETGLSITPVHAPKPHLPPNNRLQFPSRSRFTPHETPSYKRLNGGVSGGSTRQAELDEPARRNSWDTLSTSTPVAVTDMAARASTRDSARISQSRRCTCSASSTG